MKVVVLAFDGLEHDLVEKYDLLNLKQKQYGKIAIPQECFLTTTEGGLKVCEPWTPYVFSSFLTGKLPRQVGLTSVTRMKWNNPLLQALKKLSIYVGLHRIRNKGAFLEKIGFKRHMFTLPLQDTFLKYAKQPYIVNFPCLTENWSLKFSSKPTLNKLIIEVWKNFEKIKHLTLNAINYKWDILLSYIRILDILGELRIGYEEEIHEAYLEIDRYTQEIQSLFDADTVCLVMSDHGIKPWVGKYGQHSNHGFYSLNMETNCEPKNILDFYQLIVEWLKWELPETVLATMERLTP